MKKLEFTYGDSTKRLDLKKVNLFVCSSGSGKTELMNLITSIFQGQVSSANYNLQPIRKNQFNVKIVNSTNTIEDELKMTSKTEMLSITKQALQSLDNDIINKIKNDLILAVSPIEAILKDQIHLSDEDGFVFDDLLDIIKNNFVFINSKELSTSLKKYTLIYSLLSKVQLEETILLIDDFEAYFDIVQMLEIIDELRKNENITVIIFTKSIELCKYVYHEYPIFVLVRQLRDLYRIISDYFKQDVIESKNQLSFSLITEEEIKQNYTNLLRFYFSEIFLLSTCLNEDYLIEKFKKTKLYSKNDMEILKNFKKYLRKNC